MNKFLFKLVCLSFALLSCRKSNTIDEQLLRIPLGTCSQKAMGSSPLTICFDSVIQDSRCPLNVVCIWQGVAEARFWALINNQSYAFTLSSNTILPGSRTDTTIGGYTISLHNLFPYPGDTSSQVYAELKVRR